MKGTCSKLKTKSKIFLLQFISLKSESIKYSLFQECLKFCNSSSFSQNIMFNISYRSVCDTLQYLKSFFCYDSHFSGDRLQLENDLFVQNITFDVLFLKQYRIVGRYPLFCLFWFKSSFYVVWLLLNSSSN